MANSKISIKFGPINPASWHRFGDHAPIPLQQHPCYALALSPLGTTAFELNIYDGNTLIGKALAMQRQFFRVIHLTTVFRGPIWASHDIAESTKLQVYKALRAEYAPWRWKFFALMPELSEGHETNTLFKQAGYRRVVGGFSTIWLDLKKDMEAIRANLNGKWRNQLVSAEKAGLTISIGGKKPHQYAWLLEAETRQRKARRYEGLPIGMVPNFVASSSEKNGGGILSITAMSGKAKVAGALFLLHGNSATYHIGHITDEGRTLNAQNLVLFEALKALKSRDIHYLDLGGLNTADMKGIARFKLGLGADPVTLAGTYL